MGKDLTERQQQIWDMKRPMCENGRGMTQQEVADNLGISLPVVRKTLSVVYKKLGISKASRIPSAENDNPELAATALEIAADPIGETLKDKIERFNADLKASGMPEKVSAALVRRLKVKYANAVTATRELRTGEILEMLAKKIDLAMFYLDDKVMAEASARDLMMGAAMLIEKRNLLRGEPTAIISDHERKKMHELTPLLIAEAQRRGMLVNKPAQDIPQTIEGESHVVAEQHQDAA